MFNNVNRIAPRRDPEYFSAPFQRLQSSDKSLNYVGPKLYNETVNAVNKDTKYVTTSLQDKFTNSFSHQLQNIYLTFKLESRSIQIGTN